MGERGVPTAIKKHPGRIVAWAIFIFFAATIAAADQSAASAKEPVAETQNRSECEFPLPAIEQNRQYIAQLRNLTLFKDCKTEGSYRFYQRWYAERIPWGRFGSRWFAVFVIVLGAVLPLVVNWQKTEAHYKVIVPLIGALIVIAQGLSQTFAYETKWRNFMLARMKLETAQDAWQHEMIKASSASAEESLSRMQAATDVFSRQVSDAVLEETSGFFTAIQEASKARNAEGPVAD
jgi:Protein of unknown function (DUF4231)